MLNARRSLRLPLLALVALTLTAGTCDVTRDTTLATSTATPTTPTATDPIVTVTSPAPPEADDRTGQLTAIAAALNVNRLIAIENRDLNALRAIDGTDPLFSADRLLANNGGFDFVAPPTLDAIPYEITRILLDRPDCVVIATRIDLRDVLGFDEAEEQVEVVFFDGVGRASLGGILPPAVPERAWLELCDEIERTAVPLDDAG